MSGSTSRDVETLNAAAGAGIRGVVLHAPITAPSNYRAQTPLGDWLRSRDIIGIGGVDTRALTALIRDKGMPNAVIAHHPDGVFDRAALLKQARGWAGIEGTDLVPDVTSAQRSDWDETVWVARDRLRPAGGAAAPGGRDRLRDQAQYSAAAGRSRLRRDRGAGHGHGRRHLGARARRRLPVERTGRPGRNRALCGPGDSRTRRPPGADLRDLPRPSIAGGSRSAPRP